MSVYAPNYQIQEQGTPWYQTTSGQAIMAAIQQILRDLLLYPENFNNPLQFWTTINKEMVEMAFFTLDQGQKEMMDNLLEKFAWDHQELQFNKQCVNRAFDEVKNEMAHTSSMTTLDIRNLSEMIQRLAANTDAALKNSQANKED